MNFMIGSSRSTAVACWTANQTQAIAPAPGVGLQFIPKFILLAQTVSGPVYPYNENIHPETPFIHPVSTLICFIILRVSAMSVAPGEGIYDDPSIYFVLSVFQSWASPRERASVTTRPCFAVTSTPVSRRARGATGSVNAGTETTRKWKTVVSVIYDLYL